MQIFNATNHRWYLYHALSTAVSLPCVSQLQMKSKTVKPVRCFLSVANLHMSTITEEMQYLANWYCRSSFESKRDLYVLSPPLKTKRMIQQIPNGKLPGILKSRGNLSHLPNGPIVNPVI